MNETYEPMPQMVEGHVVENDGKLWTLKLREGLKFHDGQPVLARDAVASIKRWGTARCARRLAPRGDGWLSAGSDREIRFRLKKSFPLLPLALGRGSNTMAPIMPERLAMTPPTQQVTEMVGSGPYRFVAGERVPGSLAVYQRFEGYVPRPSRTASFTAGPKIANIERIEWHVIPDAATAAVALQAGEIDWWEQPTADLLPLLKRNAAIKTEIIDRVEISACYG